MQRSLLVWPATAILVAGVVAWVVVGRRAVDAAPPPPIAAVPVTVGTARVQNVPIYAQGLGTVQAINTVNVKSRVDGEIMKDFFTQGQEVAQGAPLFLIDPRPYQAVLDQARATEEKDAARLAGAERDLTRYGKLVGSGFQTRQSFEDQQATVGQMRGAVQADRAAVEAAQLNLGYTMIRSPIAGRTGALLVDPGNYVQAGAATTLVSITQIKPIYVSFTLPGDTLAAIRRAQAKGPLTVAAYAGDGTTLLATGRLSFIDNHIDPATDTIALKGTFANADERLWPGAFVSARLTYGMRPGAVTVPAQTVMVGPDNDYVYVLRPDHTVLRHDVQVAVRQDGIAVIGKGLAAGTRVVVGGQYRLANNVPVKIEADPAGVSSTASRGAD